MGMFNWTGISGVDPRPYATAIKYYCPRPGWGYPSNGENETTIYCQQDGTWSNDANIETCISMLILIFLALGINKCLFCRAALSISTATSSRWRGVRENIWSRNYFVQVRVMIWILQIISAKTIYNDMIQMSEWIRVE